MKEKEEIWEEIGSLESFIKQNPDDDALKNQLLELYLQAGNKWDEFNKIGKYLREKYPNDLSLLNILLKGANAQNIEEEILELKEHISSIKPININDYISLIEFYKESRNYDSAVNIISEAENNGITSNELFLLKLDTLIEKRDLNSVLSILTTEKLKELKDSDLYLVRAKLLMENTKNKIEIAGEVEYLCLEALKLFSKKIDAYFLLLEAYTYLLESHDKLIFLFKLAETNEIENINFYKECLTSLLKLNEINSSRELYEVIEEYSNESEKPLIKLIKVIHLELANIGLARLVWNKLSERKNQYDPQFYLSVISVGENVLSELDLSDTQDSSDTDSEKNMRFDSIRDVVNKAILHSYDMLILLEPENAEYYFLKGMFLLKIDKSQAEKALLKAIDLDSSFSYANYELGLLYMEFNRYLEAFDKFKEVLNSSFYDVNLFLETYMNLSEISIKFGLIEEGENYLDEAKNISPKDYRVHLSLGKIFFKEAKIIGSEVALDKAEYHLNEAISLNPDNCEILYFLAGVFYEKRLYLPAIKNYQLAECKGLINEKGEKFATSYNCNFWISRAYYQMYKDMLFSTKEYLVEAIKYARKISIDDKIPILFLEYLEDLYNESNLDDDSSKVKSLIESRTKKRKKMSTTKQKIGAIKILTVFSPSLTSESSEERVIFSKGNLTEIQIVKLDGEGKLIITGNIGDSFRNSINVAFGFMKNYLNEIKQDQLISDKDIYIDVPGWYPKFDGSSAGSAIAVAMISTILERPIPQSITITGEISILGDVLPVGGIKEKIEATLEKGIERVYIPKDNRWGYLDMLLKDPEGTNDLPEIIPVLNVSEIIKDLF